MQQHSPLFTLPLELRQQVYTHLLAFPAPIKLRQVIPGSREIGILRTCKAIHAEAQQMLYTLNTILVTRNDFCSHTDPALKTPLQAAHARHLLIGSFSQSIACTLMEPEARCEVCQPSAKGLVEALAAMPCLRSVVVDYMSNPMEMRRLREWVEREGRFVLETVDVRRGFESFRLRGPKLRDVSVVFQCGR